MKPFHLLGAVEQLTSHLRDEILGGGLTGTMPGVQLLAKQLGTSPKTVVEAVRWLECEGFLVSQGPGKRSKIVIPKHLIPRGLNIQILLYEKSDWVTGFVIELKLRLMEAGHMAHFATKSLDDLGMNVRRVERFVEKIEADAWIVLAASQPVLEWFANQPIPALGIFGRAREVPFIGSINLAIIPTIEKIVRQLVGLGHRRTVMISREEKRLPQLGVLERRFLELLEEQGIKTGPYNLPDWEETPAGLCQCIDELFEHSPPTAIIIDEPAIFMAARIHLAQRGIMTPRDVSMVCLNSDPVFAWSNPEVSLLDWDVNAMFRRALQWASNVAKGQKDCQKTLLKAEFIEGGTIGPAKKVRSEK